MEGEGGTILPNTNKKAEVELFSLSLSEPKVGGKPRPSMPRRTIPDPGFSYKGSAAAVTAYLHNISAKVIMAVSSYKLENND